MLSGEGGAEPVWDVPSASTLGALQEPVLACPAAVPALPLELVLGNPDAPTRPLLLFVWEDTFLI